MNYIRPTRYLDHVFEELKARSRSRTKTLKSSDVCWRVVVRLVPTSLKTDSNHSSAVTFGSMFGLFLTFCVTDVHRQTPSASWTCGFELGTILNSWEMMFGSCDVLSL